MFDAFLRGNKLIDCSDVKVGLQTGDNNRFLRQWFEVNNLKINFSCESCDESRNSDLKWYPYNKGGDFKKWYGNQNYVVNWLNDGYEIRNFKNSAGKLKSRPQNSNFYFHESLSWNKVSSGNLSFRFFPKTFLFDSVAPSIFLNGKWIEYSLGFLNSKVSNILLDIISPTLGHQVGNISDMPIILKDNDKIGICMHNY